MTEVTHESFAVAELSGTPEGLILVTVSTCTMLYAATVTIVNVALPQLQGALSATPDQIAWVVTLNVVATAVATPMTGWLVARLGQRWLMLGAVAGFAVTSLLCAVATTLESLLSGGWARASSAPPSCPCRKRYCSPPTPARDRAMAQGLFGMAVVIGPAVAPALGGYLAEAYDWRWIFYLIIPLCFAAFLPRAGLRARRREGRLGSASTGPASSPCRSRSSACNSSSTAASGSLAGIGELVVYACVAALSFYVFVTHTATVRAPFLNPVLFTDRNYVIGLCWCWCTAC